MLFLRFLPLVALIFSLSGCMFVPLFEDNDPNKTSKTVDNNMARLNSETQARMQANQNIRGSEYRAFHGEGTALPPKPTTADLEKIVEADK